MTEEAKAYLKDVSRVAGGSLVDNSSQIKDTKQLSNLIFELNVARRNVTAYPKGHPVINAAAQKVLSLVGEILESRDELSLGVAKDALMLDSSFLDRQNPIFRDFARVLFERGIALLTICKKLTAEELMGFNEILTQKREFIYEQGGIEHVIAMAGIENIRVQSIDYGLFHLSDGDDVGEAEGVSSNDNLWGDFVGGLLDGTINPLGERKNLEELTDPQILAALLNSQFVNNPEMPGSSYENAVANFIKEVDREDLNTERGRDSVTKLGLFLHSLNPQIRRLFLHSSLRSLAECRKINEEVLTRFPDELILEAIRESSKEESYAPPIIMNLLQKLAKSGISTSRTQQQDHFENATEDELLHKFRVIFREDELDKFIPRDYQNTLNRLVRFDALSLPEQSLVGQLKETLASHSIESQVTNIIMEILKTPPDDWLAGVLERNLVELCDYFLSIGDFAALLKIHGDISARLVHEEAPNPSVWAEILDVFDRPEFKEEVLKAPILWGKGTFEDIRQLINRIGEPFVEPLFNRLAEEESMSLRRFYMDRLMEMGEAARDAAILRLSDRRWYFVRNILIILRNMNDPVAVKYIRRLIPNQHPKIRTELLKALLHFQDPDGDKLILNDFASQDPEIRLSAIQVAGKSRHPEVVRVLLGMVTKSGWSAQEFETKRNAVTALAEIGSPLAIQELEKILRSVNLFNRGALNKLKLEIIRSFERYPLEVVEKLLTTYAGSRSNDLSRVAQEALRSLRGKTS